MKDVKVGRGENWVFTKRESDFGRSASNGWKHIKYYLIAVVSISKLFNFSFEMIKRSSYEAIICSKPAANIKLWFSLYSKLCLDELLYDAIECRS